MSRLSTLIRKMGRTAQVHLPYLQDAGKAAETLLRQATRKVHDPDLEGLWHISVPAEALFLDIGANRGGAARSFWTIRPDCQIICFEPNALVAERFLGPIRRRGAIIHEVALGERPGRFPLYVPVYNGVVFDGLASLERREAESWLNSQTIFFFDESKLVISEQSCSVVCLDSFAYEPFFVKIDVQGREAEVIRGGLATISRARPIIFAESESLDLRAVMPALEPLGYRFYRYDGSRFRSFEMSKSNIYFIPGDKLPLIEPVHINT